MDNESSPPTVFTIRSPRWFDKFWQGVRANRQQPFALATILAFAAMVIVGPWLSGVINIVVSFTK